MNRWLFPANYEEAVAAQREMAERVVLQGKLEHVTTVAGMDVSNNRFDPKRRVFGATVVMGRPELEVVETASQQEGMTFPYIPGLLGFREAPALVRAFEQLKVRPNVLMVDGHGVSHPRGLGIASHLGVLLDIPTIGVAKSILVGKPDGPLGDKIGSRVPLVWKGKEIAVVLRTKKCSLPLIVSAGHKITLEGAVQLVLDCLRGYRLPEPTRQAHIAANAYRKEKYTLVGRNP